MKCTIFCHEAKFVFPINFLQLHQTLRHSALKKLAFYMQLKCYFVNRTSISVLYVFVDIQIDMKHLLDTVKANFDKRKKMAIVSTIQFLTTLHTYVALWRQHAPRLDN